MTYKTAITHYLENNPDCCGCGRPACQFHHIARGPDRQTTLTNTDLGMGACLECHELFDDKGECPVTMQFAFKFKAILNRYMTITRSRISVDEVAGLMRNLGDWHTERTEREARSHDAGENPAEEYGGSSHG